MSHIVGIDLGTTNSVLCVLEGTNATVIPNPEGARVTPSVVAFTDKDGVMIGDLARRQALMNPTGTIYSIKRFMGRRFDEIPEADRKSVSYETAEMLNGDLGVRVNGRLYSPPEISAKILQKFREAAEAHLGEKVTEAVITVPAYFNDAQRKATQIAGEIAGFQVKRIINEPTAAALAYGLNQDKEKKVAVYDFGGGTFDISILEIGDGVIEVLSTSGDSRLGGDDIDQRIVDYLIKCFEDENHISIRNDKLILQRLREAAEKAKMELSSLVQTEIHLPFLTADQTGPKHLRCTLTRAQMETMIDDLVERTLTCCKEAFKNANLNVSDVDEVLLVGGSTRIPLVQKRVETFFGKAPNHSLNPDEVVGLGAAIQGGVLTGDVHDILLLDVTPLTLGVEANGGLMIPIIERNTTIPAKKTKLFSTTVDNQTSVAINVYQGERDFAAQNKHLGQFELTGIEEAPRATPQIEVCFDIDANGVLKVSAKDKKTEKYEELVLVGAGGLSEDDIRRAIHEAEVEKENDTKRKEKVVARNKLQGLSFSIAKLRRELASAASEELLQKAAKLIEKADAELAREDATAEELDNVSAELSSCARDLHEVEIAQEAAKAEEAAKTQASANTDDQNNQTP